MKLSNDSRGYFFLVATFISALGDIILVTALPQGLGFESGQISFSVIAWLIPAIAVFGASFLGKKIAKRYDSARTDYAKTLFAVAALEVVISILSLIYVDKVSSLVLAVLFLLGYAFIKEGIPRLLYQVTMYRFFADDLEYKKLVGFKGALDVLAMLVGMLIASQLVSHNTWRIGFLWDAVTFIIFGAVLIIFGRDYRDSDSNKSSNVYPAQAAEGVDRSSLQWILITVPFLHSLNALFPNYFPMISVKMGFMDIGTSIIAIALLRLPGLIMGALHMRLHHYASPRFWVRVIPVSYTLAGFLFLLIPKAATMGIMVLFSGLNAGVYTPSDIMLRNRLSGNDLVHFNTLVLRWLAVFQFVACCIAIWMYSAGDFNRPLIAGILTGFGVLAFAISHFHKKNLIRGRSH